MTMWFARTGILAALLAAAAAAAAPGAGGAAGAPALEAFPGAMGHGRYAAGGRGGAIIPVTNLDDSGRGSLRACLEAKGPRVCVFRTAGVIRFTTTRPVIRNPFLTIAGQTAPGDGIVVTHAGGKFGLTPIVIKNTHDVVVRHIRVRLDNRGDARGSDSGLIIENSSKVVIDHVSNSWAEDETIGLQGQNSLITISNSIFAEGLRHHDKCALLGSDPLGPQKLSFVRNLCAHNGDRNPDVNFYPGSCVDVINNVIYNARSDFVEVWEQHGGTPVNIIGNFFKSGPNTIAGRWIIARQSVKATGRARIYEAGNVSEGIIDRRPSAHVREALVAAPTCRPGSPDIGARRAYARVLAEAGAWPRDPIDARIVGEVERGTGRIRRDPGVLPVYAAAVPYADGDGDGMSDEWERSHGLDLKRNDAWGDADGNGWTNLDEFLEAESRRRMGGGGGGDPVVKRRK